MQDFDNAQTYDPHFKIQEPTNLKEALEPHKASFKSLGWVLIIVDETAGLYRCFKNGKERKTADVIIEYHKYVYENEIDLDDRFIETRKVSTRPWYVNSNNIPTASTFKFLSIAVERFIELAQQEAESLRLNESPASTI